MEPFEKRLIGKLSGGQQQRVLLARALVNQPKLLILDEPTSGVDKENTEEFYRLIKKFNREDGVTVFMVTHDRNCLSELADDVWHLHNGSMIRVNFERKGECDGDI